MNSVLESFLKVVSIVINKIYSTNNHESFNWGFLKLSC